MNYPGINDFSFQYDPGNDRLVATFNSTTLYYNNFSSQLIALGHSYTPADLNIMEITVTNLDPNSLAEVDLNNVSLNGNALGDFVGVNPTSVDWNVTNYSFSSGFTISGQILIANLTSTGSETNRVDLLIGYNSSVPPISCYTPTPTPTSTHTPSSTPTASDTPTFTSTPSDTPTFTNTPSYTPTPTDTPTFTSTPSDTPTFTNTPSYTPTPTNTATYTQTPSDTPTYTYTPTDTPTNTPTNTSTSSNTPTFTPTNTPSNSWYDCNWSYRKKITIDHTKVTADQTNFPVLINLASDADLAAHARSDGFDLLFTSADGTTKLSHSIESYTSATGALTAWVKVPSLSSTVDTVLYLYYGNPASADQQNATGVWDANFRAVWHLNQAFTDSTSNNNTLTDFNGNTGDVAGQMARARSFNGTNAYLVEADNANLNITNNLTLEAWIYLANSATNQKIVGKTNGSTQGYLLGVTNGRLYPEIWDSTGTDHAYNWPTPGSAVPSNAWAHIAVTWTTGGNMVGYVNGAQVGSDTAGTNPIAASNRNLRIGTAPWDPAQFYINGRIDEVRISSAARSTSWISTEYNNQSSPATFYSLDTQELSSCGTTTPTPTATYTSSPTSTFTATYTPTPTATLTPTNTPTFTPTPTATPTSTPTNTATFTPTNTATFTPTNTPLGPAWYDCNWAYRKKITIDHTKVSASQTDFPVLINLAADADLSANARADGFDLLFTSADGSTKLNHQIETYTSATGALTAWVKVPALSSTVDTVLYLYFGNPAATDQQNAVGVWDANYKAVWHLNNAGLLDSTSNGNTGTNNGTTGIAGQISRARNFNGTSYISVADDASLNVTTNLTMEAWVYLADSTTDQKIFGKTNNAPNYGYILGVQNGGLYPEIWDSAGTHRTFNSGTVASNQWVHLAVTWTTGGNMVGYVNGAQVNSISAGTNPLGTNTNPLIMGAAPWWTGGYLVNGRIDEVRISSAARSTAWIQTEYNNQNSPATFYSVETEEASTSYCGTASPTSTPTSSPTPTSTLAPLFAQDEFSYAAGALAGNNGGTGWANAWGAGNINVVASGLSHPAGGLTVAGGATQLNIGGAFGTTNSARSLTTTLGTPGTTVWISFLVKPDQTGGADYDGVNFGAAGSQLFVGYQGTNFVLNRSGGGGTSSSISFATVPFSVGQTAFVVMRVDFTAAADSATFYIDPTAGLASPDSPPSLIGTKNDLDVGTFSQIVIAGGRGFNANLAQLDEIRVGSTYLAVAPSTPVPTATPTPTATNTPTYTPSPTATYTAVTGTFWFYNATTPQTYMMYQSQPSGAVTTAIIAFDFYSPTFTSGYRVNAGTATVYLYAIQGPTVCNLAVTLRAGATVIGSGTLNIPASNNGYVSTTFASSQYSFNNGEGLRLSFGAPCANTSPYWDGGMNSSRLVLP